MPNKPKLVLLHGWAMSSATFQPWLAYLNPHFEIANFDLPGHGNSPWPELNADPLAALFEQIKTFLGDEGGLLLGWSLGGLVAHAYYALYPDSVKALILMASTPKFEYKPAQLKQMALQLLNDFNQTLSDFLSLQTISMEPANIKAFLSLYKQTTPPNIKALNWGLHYLETADFRTAYPLNCKTLIILGEKDRLVPNEIIQELIKANKNIRVEILTKSAHLPFWTEPETCLNLLLELVCAIPRSPT